MFDGHVRKESYVTQKAGLGRAAPVFTVIRTLELESRLSANTTHLKFMYRVPLLLFECRGRRCAHVL